jgi:hypothetical protein
MASFKEHTKFNFILNGAKLDDPGNLFNNGLKSSKSRSIDAQEGEQINWDSLKPLVREAINLAS